MAIIYLIGQAFRSSDMAVREAENLIPDFSFGETVLIM